MSNIYNQSVLIILVTLIIRFHYENTTLRSTGIYFGCKNENFDIFLVFAQNIDLGYTLEPPRRGGSNE